MRANSCLVNGRRVTVSRMAFTQRCLQPRLVRLLPTVAAIFTQSSPCCATARESSLSSRAVQGRPLYRPVSTSGWRARERVGARFDGGFGAVVERMRVWRWVQMVFVGCRVVIGGGIGVRDVGRHLLWRCRSACRPTNICLWCRVRAGKLRRTSMEGPCRGISDLWDR